MKKFISILAIALAFSGIALAETTVTSVVTGDPIPGPAALGKTYVFTGAVDFSETAYTPAATTNDLSLVEVVEIPEGVLFGTGNYLTLSGLDTNAVFQAYKSTDGGETWATLGSPITATSNSITAHALTFNGIATNGTAKIAFAITSSPLPARGTIRVSATGFDLAPEFRE